MTAEFFLDANQRKRDNLPSKFWEKKTQPKKRSVHVTLFEQVYPKFTPTEEPKL